MADESTPQSKDITGGQVSAGTTLTYLPHNWLKNRLWVRSDHDFRARLEQVAVQLNTDMSKILRDGAEREIEFLRETHPRLKDFQFMELEQWLAVREEKLGLKKKPA